MSDFTAIDLSKLPAPDLVKELDFEVILKEWIDLFLSLYPDYDAQTLESEPIMKLLEAGAYREMTWRQRVNDASAIRTDAGEVTVTILVHAGDGMPDDEIIAEEVVVLNATKVRPLTDKVILQK